MFSCGQFSGDGVEAELAAEFGAAAAEFEVEGFEGGLGGFDGGVGALNGALEEFELQLAGGELAQPGNGFFLGLCVHKMRTRLWSYRPSRWAMPSRAIWTCDQLSFCFFWAAILEAMRSRVSHLPRACFG